MKSYVKSRHKIGLVGFGGIGQQHAKVIAESQNCEFTAIVEINDANRSLALHLYGASGVQMFSDFGSEFIETEIDTWIVASDTKTHVSMAKKLLSAGKNVLLEKPIGLSVAEAMELKDFIKNEPTNFMMGHILLFSDEFIALSATLQNRSPIQSVEFRRYREKWHMEKYPNDTLFSLIMVHDLYTAFNLMPENKPIQIQGQAHFTNGGKADLAMAQLSWKSGQLASFVAGFVHPNGSTPEVHDSLIAHGEDWIITLEYFNSSITIESTESKASKFKIFNGETDSSSTFMSRALTNQFNAFLDVIDGVTDITIGASYQDALVVQDWIEQLTQKSNLG